MPWGVLNDLGRRLPLGIEIGEEPLPSPVVFERCAGWMTARVELRSCWLRWLRPVGHFGTSAISYKSSSLRIHI